MQDHIIEDDKGRALHASETLRMVINGQSVQYHFVDRDGQLLASVTDAGDKCIACIEVDREVFYAASGTRWDAMQRNLDYNLVVDVDGNIDHLYVARAALGKLS